MLDNDALQARVKELTQYVFELSEDLRVYRNRVEELGFDTHRRIDSLENVSRKKISARLVQLLEEE